MAQTEISHHKTDRNCWKPKLTCCCAPRGQCCRIIGCTLLLCAVGSYVHFAFVSPPPTVTAAIARSGEQAAAAFKQPNNVTRLIVDWTGFFGGDLVRAFDPRQCSRPPSNCRYVSNHSLAAEADAVLFHAREIDWAHLPPVRYLHQRYMFFSMESPYHSGDLIQMEMFGRNFFNWTATYRLDSDFAALYYTPWRKRAVVDRNALADYETIVKEKTKPIAWFASNCDTPSRRELYVAELQKYVEVDIFGACGPLQCSPSNGSNCELLIRKNYLFYIAFENSVCVDYATEKIVRMYNDWVVPIVLNAQAYKHLPPTSYIAADHFGSAEKLAEHILYLVRHPQRYREYHTYRMHYEPGAPAELADRLSEPLWCQVCHALHNPAVEVKVYDDIVDWWVHDACTYRFAETILTSHAWLPFGLYSANAFTWLALAVLLPALVLLSGWLVASVTASTKPVPILGGRNRHSANVFAYTKSGRGLA